MRTVVREIKVFKFSELSEDGKEHAKENDRSNCGYSWRGEALKSIKALTEHFGGKVVDYSVDWFGGSYSSMKFGMPDMEREEIIERLGQLGTFDPESLRGHGDCKLTGFCHESESIKIAAQWLSGQ